jgi:hypothetical protein
MTVETNQDQLDVQVEAIESSSNQAEEVEVEIIDAPPAISDEASEEISVEAEAAEEVAAGEEAEADDAEEATEDEADDDAIEASDDESADDGSDDADDDSEATD